MDRLQGKVGIVTGAAGGIAAAAVRAFVAEGAHVGLLDRDDDRLAALAAELGDAATPIPADVRDEASVQAAFTRFGDRVGRADFVYVCAGTQLHGEDGPAGEVPLDVWNRTIAVNLTGAFLCVKHSIELLRVAATRSGASSLVLVGSPTGLTMTGAGYAAYSASKAGMMSLARTVAGDYAADGIRANIVVPGTTETPLIAQLLADGARRAELETRNPLGRIGTPEELTGIAVFLVSDESRYATGSTFHVDAGMCVR